MTTPKRRHTDWSDATLQIIPPGEQPVVEAESAEQHIRNALQILRYSMEHDEPLIHATRHPAVAVPITSLARIQARLEAAIERLAGGAK